MLMPLYAYIYVQIYIYLTSVLKLHDMTNWNGIGHAESTFVEDIKGVSKNKTIHTKYVVLEGILGLSEE